MKHADSEAGEEPRRLGFTGILVLVLAGWVCVATVEMTTMAGFRWIWPRITRTADSFVWMVPAYYLGVFVLLGAALAVITRFLRHRAAFQLTVTSTATLAAFSILLLPLYGQVNQWALLLLATGIGVQLGRWSVTRGAGLIKVARVMVVGLGIPIALLAAGVPAFFRWQERASYGKLPAPVSGAPNVLLIIFDTVRAASLGLYGHSRPTTPNLSEAAEEWVVFDHAYSTTSWTLPSHASMFTGLYPHQMGADWLTPLEKQPRTLAETFRAAGYRTGGFVANLTYASRETGLARGFIHYEDYPASGWHLRRATSLSYFFDTWRAPIKPGRRSRASKPARQISESFLSWADQDQERPFFAFLNYFDAHQPYRAPDSLLRQFRSENRVEGRYESAIASLDQELAHLLRQLEQRHRLESTVVILTSDHGELLGEYNLKGHANSLYLPVLRVPLLLRHDGRTPVGLRVSTPVTLRDLAATIVDLAGSSERFPGHSLTRFWQPPQTIGEPSWLLAQITKGIRTPPEDPVSRGTMKAIIGGTHQLVINGDGREELFDLAADRVAPPVLADSPAQRETRETLRSELNKAFATPPDSRVIVTSQRHSP
jgi:arylsulfatase A-like enzyme